MAIVVPVLLGGLGNTLFQIAAAADYAQRHGLTVAFSAVPDLNPHCPADPPVSALFPAIPLAPRAAHGVTRHASPDAFAHVLFPAPTPEDALIEIAGYCQHIAFVPTSGPFMDWPRHLPQVAAVGGPGVVAVHVRRGDYVGHAALGHDLATYRARAMALWPVGTRFVVFTDAADDDDVGLPPGPGVTRAPRLTAMETLAAMRACEGGIVCANSTLSWWAAWAHPGREAGTARVTLPARWSGTAPETTAGLHALPGAIIVPTD